MSSEGVPALDGPGKELYERIAPSLVDLEVAGRDGERWNAKEAVPALHEAWQKKDDKAHSEIGSALEKLGEKLQE